MYPLKATSPHLHLRMRAMFTSCATRIAHC